MADGLLSPSTDINTQIGKLLSPDINTDISTQIDRLLSPDFKAGDILSPRTSLENVLSPSFESGDILSPKTNILSDQMGLLNLKGSFDTSKKALILAPQTIVNSPFASQSNQPTQRDSGLGVDLSPTLGSNSLVTVVAVTILAGGIYMLYRGVTK